MIKNKIIRRCVRLLTAVHELHKQGYQDLAVLVGRSSSGAHWRLSLFPFEDILIDRDGGFFTAPPMSFEENYHSSGACGNEYFGWKDATKLNARELAENIKERFPRLVSSCKRTNFEYVGWYSYMLGQAEKGNLPIMYQDYHQPSDGHIATTGEGEILIPPHPKIQEANGRKFYYSKSSFVTDDCRDWHSAYKSIIDDFRASEISRFPFYPYLPNELFELAAYWEGCIYYIQEVLGYCRIDDFLNALNDFSKTSERWSSFLAIWDNFGQLVYLRAFLIRHMLNDMNKYPFSAEQRNGWMEWLTNFEQYHGFVNSTVMPTHNPYFGGSNPLHLGGILQDRNIHGEDPLI